MDGGDERLGHLCLGENVILSLAKLFPAIEKEVHLFSARYPHLQIRAAFAIGLHDIHKVSFYPPFKATLAHM